MKHNQDGEGFAAAPPEVVADAVDEHLHGSDGRQKRSEEERAKEHSADDGAARHGRKHSREGDEQKRRSGRGLDAHREHRGKDRKTAEEGRDEISERRLDRCARNVHWRVSHIAITSTIG